MENTIIHSSQSITATLVPENKRLNFLPRKLPKDFSRFENWVFNIADEFLEKEEESKKPCYWDFMMLSNGSFYLRPGREDLFNICWWENGYEGIVSADAFGIITTLFALCRLAEATAASTVIEYYYDLKDYAEFHPEASAIYRAID